MTAESLQVSRSLSILDVPNNAVFWIVCTCPPASKSSSPFNNPLITVPKGLLTIGIIVTFMFHIFFNSLARPRYFSFHSHHFSFFFGQPWQQNLQFWKFPFFLILVRAGLLVEIRWSVWMSKSHSSLSLPFSRTAAGLCIYYLFLWSI